jgi:IS605 OrfB family transposase
LVELAAKPGLSRESVTEMLARVCGRAIAMARRFGAATIAVEDGLGRLRSTGPARALSRTLNYWARNRLIPMLRRKANLAGITVIEVRGAYSTIIGNLAFEAPDACASAMEIVRRGIAAGAKLKDLLPVFDEGWRDGLRKDLALPAEAEGWEEVRRSTGPSKRRRLAFAARIQAYRLGPRRPPRPAALRCDGLADADEAGSLPGRSTSVGFESNTEIRIAESGKTWRDLP